jgi:hypothetical protein
MLNFLGIGAQKCGTTWLYDTLAKHAGIAFPGGKEVHYWNSPQGKSIEWYSTLFNDDTQINGDITPAYALLPKTTIEKIYSRFPNLRLIYLIRDPMERAWSAARMALGRAEMLHNEASDQWFLDHFQSSGSLARGDYEKCIRQWLSVYDPSQLLIVRYESICTDPVNIINTCLKHILSDRFVSIQDRVQLSKKIFEGDGVPLPSRLRDALKAIYAPRIESLSGFLHQDFSDWSN